MIDFAYRADLSTGWNVAVLIGVGLPCATLVYKSVGNRPSRNFNLATSMNYLVFSLCTFASVFLHGR